MDVTAGLKSLFLDIHQYRENRTAQNEAQLQKQVEEVSRLKCDQLLSSGQTLPVDCVSGLVELAGNPSTSPSLTSAIISLLAQLACDDAGWEILHSSYNLTSTLACVIHRHSTTPGEPLVLQCLQVLQKLTYNIQVFSSTYYIHELIAFLMTNIQSQNEDILKPCLGLMTNLCRDNHSVQSHIKSLDNVKPFYRTLINFLAHNSLTVVVFTLSILASLTLNEKVGEKLFDGKNIYQTFQLVFNIIVNGDGTLTKKYSVDLLVDLLKNPKIADYLTRYEHFSACMSQVLGQLQSKDPDSAAKVLELLLAMCSISGLRSLLCEVVFRPAGPKLRAGRCRQVDGGMALVQWLSSPVEGAESCSLQTLQLLNELLEEALEAETLSNFVLSFVEMLLPVLLALLKGLDPARGDAHLRKLCHRITHVTRLLLTLCGEDSTRSLVSRQVSAELCLSQVETLLSCCHGNSPITCLPAGSETDLSQVCAEALLRTLELMSKLSQQVKDMETSYYRMLQDQRIVTPLAFALTSHNRERVQTGLSLLFEATPLPDFPSLILGESIAANNAYRQRGPELSVKRVAVQEVPPSSTLDSSRSVNSLTEKIQNGLKVECVQLQDNSKTSRVSEIIDVYNQKLSALSSHESGLQDLLETKALALSQADRLIAQYRFQRAQAESEACKLGSLLKETEQQRGDLQLEVERLKADTEMLLQHNIRLQEDSEKHQALKEAYNMLHNRFNESERLLKEWQTSFNSLTIQNDALKKNYDALQQKQEKMSLVLKESEEEITLLNRDIAGLRSELRSKEEKVRANDQERMDLEETVDVLRKELNKTEQARKDASIKVSSLELKISQLESKLKQREEELKKHSTMVSMIHSLTSGPKGNIDLTL